MSVFTIFFFSLEEIGEKEFLGEVGKLEGKGKKNHCQDKKEWLLEGKRRSEEEGRSEA